MLSRELLTELRQLSRADKLRAMQLLVSELASEEPETYFTPGTVYEIWTPYGNEAAAEVLRNMLEAEEKAPLP